MCVHCTNPAELGLCRSANSDLTVLSHQTSTLATRSGCQACRAEVRMPLSEQSQTRVDVIAEIIYIIYGDSCLSASVPGARVSGLTFGLHGVHIVRRGFGVHVLHNTTGMLACGHGELNPHGEASPYINRLEVGTTFHTNYHKTILCGSVYNEYNYKVPITAINTMWPSTCIIKMAPPT